MKNKSTPTPWEDKKVKLKERYPTLTEEDLTYRHGDVDSLIDKIKKRIGKSRREVKRIIKRM